QSQPHPLVDGAGLCAALPRGAEHEVRAGQRRAQVSGRGQPRQRDRPALTAQLLAQALDHRGDGAQPRGVDVVQGDLVDGESGDAGGDRLVDQGDAEASASQDGELHGSSTSTSSPSGSAMSKGRGERSVITPENRDRGATSRKPEPGNFSWSANR